MFDDLKMIKKMYGEDMMHLCRELFPTILETPGLMYSLMEKNFAPNHYLFEDLLKNEQINNFKRYICELMNDVKKEEKEESVIKSPYELMDDAGYILYECKSERDIQKFKKYYSPGEELCTFNGGRLNRCHVFFAVKKNVSEIKRNDFSNPNRQDEYGTSVISIQFTRGGVNTLSIKNRYNHRVKNPDATFSNNLDNIIYGLTASFEKMYGFNINQNESNVFEIPGYVKANDGKYYKYNYELRNVYYCPGNIVIDNFEVKRDYQEKEKYIIADYFIIDLVKKEVRLYDYELYDCFVDGLHDIKNIRVFKNKENDGKTIIITPNDGEDIIIEIDKYNRIISYRNNNLIEIGYGFLMFNEVLSDIELSEVQYINGFFLQNNNSLTRLYLPKLRTVGRSFLSENTKINDLSLPCLISTDSSFLAGNRSLVTLNLPNLKYAGNQFLYRNTKIKKVNLPKLEKVRDYFLNSNLNLRVLSLPKLKEVGFNFLYYNRFLWKLDLPSLTTIESHFLYHNISLIKFNCPNVEKIDDFYFMPDNILCNYFLTRMIQKKKRR